jgi:adenylate cyclase class IV
MSSKNLEIEIKVLLEDSMSASKLLEKLRQMDPHTALLEKSSQLNHYFLVTNNDNFNSLYLKIAPFLRESEKDYFKEITNCGVKHSVRTRQLNDKVLFVMKAGMTATGQGANGTNRLELEVALPMTLNDLDSLILQSGFRQQSKWSRDREEYVYKDLHVCIDRNAGYGFIAEFEKVLPQEDALLLGVDNVRQSILDAVHELGFTELDASRLERMFAFYNDHWLEYYGTDKTFLIE